MAYVIDKTQVWQAALEMVDEYSFGPGLFWQLWNECYLDSVEDGLAIVGVPSNIFLTIFHQKASRLVRHALEEVLGYPVRVKAVVGSPRLFTRLEEVPQIPADIPNADVERHELALLHERYGDIMGIVDNHPLFKKASIPLEKGGWGIWPQKLTLFCKEYGVMAVLNCLRYISNKPSVRKPRGFFFEAMERGQFGHKLAISRDVTGPVQAVV